MRRIYAYHIAVFLSAFLLFQVQPMTSKALLPGFGGSYLVWAGCMVFYQGMLLAGYVYAHFAQRALGVRRYARLHWLLLLAPVLFFPFHFDTLTAGNCGLPLAPAVFVLLLVTVGLPFFALSTTSLVLQRWLSVSDLPERDNPYVLYAASNLGSMLALLTYPVLVEPFMGLEMQGYVWWGGYAALVVLHVACRDWSRHGKLNTQHPTPNAQLPRKNHSDLDVGCWELGVGRSSISWFFLSLAACFALLAVTNVITFDVASVPFLWVLPLSIYLLAFVLTFKRKPWFPKWGQDLLYWAIPVGIVLHLLKQVHMSLPIVLSLTLYSAILFVICLNCAGRLVQRKPDDPRRLTTFYVVIALGGLVGSLLVAWVVPVVSCSLVEWPAALVLACFAVAVGPGSAELRPRPAIIFFCMCIVLVSVVAVPWLAGRIRQELNPGILAATMAFPVFLAVRYFVGRPWPCAAVLLAAAVGMCWTEDLASGVGRVRRLRNFYGIYRVFDRDGLRYLQHGTTQHGRQYISGPDRETPLGYYHPTTPAAEVLASDEFSFAEIGMIGLGTGALACYTGSNQVFTVYELDPDNLAVARENFSYLDIAEERGVDFRFVPGDGRISIGRRKRGSLDLLIVDAFNSGSIPVHLLTVEALEDYAGALDADGVLLMHVSNKVLDLRPVLESNAAAAGLAVCSRDNAGRTDPDAEETYWMAFSREPGVVETLVDELGWRMREPGSRLPRPWTDRYSNLLSAVAW